MAGWNPTCRPTDSANGKYPQPVLQTGETGIEYSVQFSPDSPLVGRGATAVSLSVRVASYVLNGTSKSFQNYTLSDTRLSLG